MTSKDDSNRAGGIGFFSVLALIFITLKLTGHIQWPWMWVLAPIWMPLSVGLVIFATCLWLWRKDIF